MYRRVQERNLAAYSDLSKMLYNEACLLVVNKLNTTITIKKKAVECFTCDLMFWDTLDPNSYRHFAVDIGYVIQFGVVESCKKTSSFKQHGVYRWVVDSGCHDVEKIKQSDLAYTPLIVVIGVVLIVFVFYKMIELARRHEMTRKLYDRLRKRYHKDTAESDVSGATTIGTNATTQTANSLPVPQVLCIQAFRGLVVLSIMVFYGESNRYWFLRNSAWNGILPADFVHPWFLWGLGAVFYLKYRASLLNGSSRLKVVGEAALRTMKYVLLGVCLNSFENEYTNGRLRFPGELQRCGVIHFIIFVVEIARMKKEVIVDKIWQWKVWKLPDRWIQYTFVIVCLIVHALVTYLLPVPNCPTGYTGPGGAHMNSKHQNCTGGAARYIDSLVFTDNHLDGNPVCKRVYKTLVPFDSAGLLGILNCFLTIYSGIYAAGVFVYHSKTNVRLAILLTCGVVQTFLGCSFCLFSKEGGMPLNGPIWSLSFALLTSGAAFFALALLHVLIDVSSLWLGSPLFEAGLNTMLLYAGHAVLRYSVPFSWTPIDDRNYTEFVIMDLISITFWIFVSKLAYKHERIFLI